MRGASLGNENSPVFLTYIHRDQRRHSGLASSESQPVPSVIVGEV